MHLTELDLDQDCSHLEEVTSSKIHEHGKISETGLFSQQIFGPIKSYYCECNKDNYYGKSSGVSKCPKCKVDITSSEVRKKRFAKIVLPFKILNPLYYYILTKSKPSLRQVILSLLSYKNKYYFDENGILIKMKLFDDDVPEGTTLLEGLPGALTIIDNLIENTPDDPNIAYIQSHYSSLTIKHVIVIPPDFRPCHHDSTNKLNISDQINHYYSLLLARCKSIKANPLTLSETDDMYRLNFKYVQTQVIELYDYIFQKLSKKEGLLRSNILGKRVDFSGRAVISPDPTLSLDQCRVPYIMILEILKPQFVSFLVERRVCKWYNIANNLVEDCIKKEDYSLMDLINEFCKDKVCVLNRQPTLHRLSVLGFNVVPHKGKTIGLHPMICEAFNADFDGDSFRGKVELSVQDDSQNSNLKLTKDISDLPNSDLFKFESTHTRDDGVIVSKYIPTKVIETQAIDITTGNTCYKRINELSVHEQIDMYRIHDPQNEFEDFMASYDHSLIVFDEVDGQIKKISPKELLINPTGKYLIKEEC